MSLKDGRTRYHDEVEHHPYPKPDRADGTDLLGGFGPVVFPDKVKDQPDDGKTKSDDAEDGVDFILRRRTLLALGLKTGIWGRVRWVWRLSSKSPRLNRRRMLSVTVLMTLPNWCTG